MGSRPVGWGCVSVCFMLTQLFPCAWPVLGGHLDMANGLKCVMFQNSTDQGL